VEPVKGIEQVVQEGAFIAGHGAQPMAGGSRYMPTTSRILNSNSGSVLNLNHINLIDRRPTGPRPVLQPRDPALNIAVAPADHSGPRHPDGAGDLRVRHPGRGQQNHPGPLRQARWHTRQPGQITQPFPVTLTQQQCRS
jgi:hypothetical protein